MIQFLIGFWCGCLAATLVWGLLYANKGKQSEETEKEEPGAEEGTAFAAGPKILLIDDSRLSRKVMKEYLAKRHPQVFEAGSGPEGVKLAKSHSFDVIFVDQCMPGMDGDETLHRLHKDAGVEQNVPIIAVGSAVRKENEAELRLKGYVTCLGKPIQENRLDEILTEVLPEKESVPPEGFFYEKGLDNFDGNDEGYRETLVLFADLWLERRAQLKLFLDENNMQEYAILIHAIKGDARTLGADGLGELAYAQELSAKAGDSDAIKSTFDRVMGAGDAVAEYFKKMYS